MNFGYDPFDEWYEEIFFNLFPDNEEIEGNPVEQTDDEYKPPKKRKKRRNRDYKNTTWYRFYILDDEKTFSDPLHSDGRKFECRFSLSREEVLGIVTTLKTHEDSPFLGKKICDESDRLLLLVLAALRILTRNWTFDDVDEATDISRQVHEAFFIKFVKFYGEVVLPTLVKMPEPTAEAVRGNSNEFNEAGVPNALGSMDAVHIRLWNVASNLKQVSTGKEKYPTRHL